MIDHISVGCNNINEAKIFYNEILPLFAYKPSCEGEKYIGYKSPNGPDLWVVIPIDESRPFTPSNGFHLCFKASSNELVDQFYEKAIKAGATCTGTPGIRKEYGSNYYAAYILDPEGNKLEAASY